MYTQTYIYTYNSMTYYLYIYTTYTQIYFIYIYLGLLYPAIVGYCTLASKGSGELPEFPFAQQVLGGERCKCKSLGRLCLRPPFKGGVPPRSASKAAFATQADNKERQQPHMPLHPPQRHTSPPPTEVKTRTETRECQIAQEPRCVQPNNREEQCRSKNVATACVAVVSNIRHVIHQFKMYTYIYIYTYNSMLYYLQIYTKYTVFFSYIYICRLYPGIVGYCTLASGCRSIIAAPCSAYLHHLVDSAQGFLQDILFNQTTWLMTFQYVSFIQIKIYVRISIQSYPV